MSETRTRRWIRGETLAMPSSDSRSYGSARANLRTLRRCSTASVDFQDFLTLSDMRGFDGHDIYHVVPVEDRGLREAGIAPLRHPAA